MVLSEKEFNKKPWIALNLAMLDFPYYDYKGKGEDIVISSKEDADKYLGKYMNRSKKKE